MSCGCPGAAEGEVDVGQFRVVEGSERERSQAPRGACYGESGSEVGHGAMGQQAEGGAAGAAGGAAARARARPRTCPPTRRP
eukprot:1720119-Rhodomonas_salina.1